MNNLETISNNILRIQHTNNKQLNKLLAEATILLLEIEALVKKGDIKQ